MFEIDPFVSKLITAGRWIVTDLSQVISTIFSPGRHDPNDRSSTPQKTNKVEEEECALES